MKVVVIDAFSLIHRAYHAMPGFTTKSGEPSGAVYGFCSMFLKLVDDFAPDSVIACFDLKEKTFRHDLFPEYQAQRESKPDDFYVQVERVKQFLSLLSVQIVSFSGHDADDAVGSVAEKFRQDENNEVIILSGDNDMLQLVRDRVKVFSLRKGITDVVVYDAEAVKNKYGFEPDLLPDFKALAGDASDNIPGVMGIGQKTATTLIQEHGGLESIYQALEKNKIKDSLAKKLQENKEKAFLFKDLATIRKNLVVKIESQDFSKERLSSQEAIRFFEEFGFKSLLKRINAVSEKDPAEQVLSEFKKLDFTDFPKKLLSAKRVFVLKHEEYFWISFGKEKIRLEQDAIKIVWSKVLENPKIEVVTFDFKNLLQEFGLPPGDLFMETKTAFVWDLKILGWLADSEISGKDLGVFIKRFLKKELQEDLLIEMFVELFEKVSAIQEILAVYREIEAPLMTVLFKMEQNGIKIDQKVLSSFEKDLEQKIHVLQDRILSFFAEKINLNSPKELSRILYEELKLPTKKQRKLKSGYFSTDSESLEKIKSDHEVVGLILEWRELTKLMNTYVKTLPNFVDPGSKRLKTTFLQTGTTTGRLASESPNLQNIPKHVAWSSELRQAFVSERGWSFLAFDYSQIELRLAASLSRDKDMVDAFLSGQDIHKKTASIVWDIPFEKVSKEQRFRAKALNFGVLYGMGSRSLAETAKVSQEEARIFIDDYFHNFPGLKNHIDKTLEFLRENGYVETVFGRRRYLPDIHSGRPQFVAQAQRMALNLTLQGLAADIIKKAMIKIDQKVLPKYQGKAKMILQIHDELLFEIKDEIIEKILPEIKSAMESVYQDSVPILVESHLGKNWDEVD